MIETTTGIGRRPSVQFRLHHKYRVPCLRQVARPRNTRIHRRVSFYAFVTANHTEPLRHVAGFPDLGLLRALRPLRPASAGDGPARPPVTGCHGTTGAAEGFPVHCRPFDRGRHLAMPLTIAMATPLALHHGLPVDDILRPRSSPPGWRRRVRGATQPMSARFRAGGSLEGRSRHWFLTYTYPSRLPSPHHLAVLRRLVVVRAAVHPCPSRGLDCPQLHPLLRQ